MDIVATFDADRKNHITARVLDAAGVCYYEISYLITSGRYNVMAYDTNQAHWPQYEQQCLDAIKTKLAERPSPA